jgi:hypothetical protein
MSFREQLFQLVVIDFSKRNNEIRETHFNSSLIDFNTDRKVKVADVAYPVASMTLFRRAKDHRQAQKWGEKFGTVLSCFKVDKTKYLENIEHLNLHQEPRSIEIDKGELFTLNANLEIDGVKNTSIEISLDK